MPLFVTPSEVVLPPVPKGRLMEIHGTAPLPDAQWRELARLPGSFFFDDRGSPVPASGEVAVIAKYNRGGWPDPIFLPRAQWSEVSRGYPEMRGSVHAFSLPLLPSPAPLGFTPRNGMTLYPFQLDAVRHFLVDKRLLLLLPVGSGKTGVAVFAGEELRLERVIDRVVVAASETLVHDLWLPSLRAMTGVEPTIIEGAPTRRAKLWASSSPWFLTKYDTWRTDRKAFRSVLGPRTMVIIEEVHHLKSPRTKRWRAMRDLLDETDTDYRLFLTGTLLYDKPVDSFGPISLLGLRVWNTYDEFVNRYFDLREFPTGNIDKLGRPVFVEVPEQLKGPDEAEMLRAVIDSVSFRRTRDEVGLELPPLTEDTRIISATEEESKLYDEAILKPLREAAGNPETKSTENRIFALLTMERLLSADPRILTYSDSETAHEIRGRLTDDRLIAASPGSKVRALVEYLADFIGEDDDAKVVVFSAFTGLARLLHAASVDTTYGDEEFGENLATVMASAAFLEGEMNIREREATLSAFKTDRSTRVLFSTDIGGEGIDGLQGVAAQVLHYDDPLSLGKYEQRVGRVWRRGQTRPVLSLRFELSPEKLVSAVLSEAHPTTFVDARLRELLSWKSSQKRMVLSD